MNEDKSLWSYAVFRWFVYQTPLLVFGLLLRSGYFDYSNYGRGWIGNTHWSDTYEIIQLNLYDYAILIWILILTLPTIWVWRKPIWKRLKQAIGFLNKKAEEDYK